MGPAAGFQEKSVSWLLRKKPSTMRPDPKYDSIVVVIDTALPRASTMTMWLVPPGSSVRSSAVAGAPCGWPAEGAGTAAGVASSLRGAAKLRRGCCGERGGPYV